MSIKNKILLLILLCATGCNTSDAASDDSIKIQQLKFKMLQSTVAFYITDSVANPGKKKNIEYNAASNAAELANFAKDLKGVSKKIEKFDSVVIADKHQLEAFKTQIVAEVGSRPYRKEMASYKKFREVMDKIIEEAPDDPTQVAVKERKTAPRVNTPTEPKSPPPPAAIQETSETRPVPEASEPAYLGLNWWNGSAVALAMLALAISIWSRKTKRKSSRSSSEKSNNNQFAIAFNEQVASISDKFRNLSNRIDGLDQKMTRVESQRNIRPEPSLQVNNHADHTIKAGDRKYAKTADNKSFDPGSLSTDPDNKKIFEITFENANRGSFVVTENREAQLFALDDPANYLRGACTYSTSPAHDSKIVTIKKGIVELRDTKWMIVSPAEIDFA